MFSHNAVNAISETQILNIFQSMPPDHLQILRLQLSAGGFAIG
jgi:hypothetical protein